MKKTFILFIVVIFILAGCGKNSYETIGMDKAQQMIEDNKDLTVLDVRTPEEYAEGHIPGATLLPVDELENRIGELDSHQTYIVVCRSGNRSKTASEILLKNNFMHIYNTSGGMNEWTGTIEK